MRCEHKYPYFIRWYDDILKTGKMIERHCYCFICEKEYIIKLPKSMCIGRMYFGLERGREKIEDLRQELPKIIERYNKCKKTRSESSGDAVLEDSTSPKAEPEAEKTKSESREQEHEQKGD